MNEKHQALVDWLKKCCNCFNLFPAEVFIGEQHWETAAFYQQRFLYTAGMDAVSRGDKKVGDEYVESSLYVIGKLPDAYRGGKRRKYPRGNVCFPFQSEDWYVAGYIENAAALRHPEYHPFGACFMLRPWCVPDGSAIDAGERKPYQRIQMAVIYV